MACMLDAVAMDIAGATVLVQEAGPSKWATVQAALLSAIPFGFATISMRVSAFAWTSLLSKCMVSVLTRHSPDILAVLHPLWSSILT